ncbi:MAG: SRPBCC family protein [Chloroflexi bacterium]|nr:SRPBCC family protein [Chloroflexota bacterium]
MPANEYHFLTHWRIEGTIEEISEILGDAESLPRWWPRVYLNVKVLEPGDERGVGRVIQLLTRGWLPYTLRWSFRLVENREPHGYTIEAFGDFVGRGAWTLNQDGPVADIVYDWRIRADKPLLKWLSPVLKPIFRANHRWAMARGEESLIRELQRRRAAALA